MLLHPASFVYREFVGALERIRTSDPQLRKLVLYPLSYERARTPIISTRAHGPWTRWPRT